MFNPEVQDSGPRYVETLSPNLWFFEPWNTASNIIFLIVIIYWTKKTALNHKDFPLIVLALPILLIGLTGGSIYHATRSSNLWLYLDFIPIILLSFMAAVYFWKRLLKNFILGVLIAGVFVFTPRLLLINLDLPFYIFVTASYSSLATMILLPAYLLALREKISYRTLNWAVLTFILAISFRSLDSQLSFLLPMGSHFLWHVFGAISTHSLLYFIYQLNCSTQLKLK